MILLFQNCGPTFMANDILSSSLQNSSSQPTGIDVSNTRETFPPGVYQLGKSVSHLSLLKPEGVSDEAYQVGYASTQSLLRPPYSRAGLHEMADQSDGSTDTGAAHLYRVTSLLDPSTLTAGTLRHAVTKNTPINNPGHETHGLILSGPRIVVFDIAGVINVSSRDDFNIRVNRPKTYVAGQTAPGQVVLFGGGIWAQASDVVVRHLAAIPGLPDSINAGKKSSGFGALMANGQMGRRIWFDQMSVFAWADQAPVIYSIQKSAVEDVAFTNFFVGDPYRAPNLDPPWSNFEKRDHNLGPLIGSKSNRITIAGSAIIGCNFRNPLFKRGSLGVVFSNFIHDFGGDRFYERHYWPAPVQVSGVDDTYEDLSNYSLKGDTSLSVVGNYAEPGYSTREFGRSGTHGRTKISGSFVVMEAGGGLNSVDPASSKVNQNTFVYMDKNRFDTTLVGKTWAVELDPETGEAPPPPKPASDRAFVLSSPKVWSDYIPTHPSKTRQWVVQHAGSRPNDPLPIQKEILEALGEIRFSDWLKPDGSINRPALFRTTATQPSSQQATLKRAHWKNPKNMWSIQPNGLTKIENILNQLSVDIGGVPWGNIDRELTTASGGRLLLTKEGTLSWDTASDLSGQTVKIQVTFHDGETRRLQLTN